VWIDADIQGNTICHQLSPAVLTYTPEKKGTVSNQQPFISILSHTSGHHTSMDVPSHWDPEILKQYLQDVQESDSDDAISTDDEMSTDNDDDQDKEHHILAPLHPDLNDDDAESLGEGGADTFSEVTTSDIIEFEPLPRDDTEITSDDSAFSSEDDFASDRRRRDQWVERSLMLARPAGAILGLRARTLARMHEEYMCQLDAVDEELAELRGEAYVPVVRGVPIAEGSNEGRRRRMRVGYMETVELVEALRRRGRGKEIVRTGREALVEQLVVLAQALFRKNKEIKQLYKEKGHWGVQQE
jgi:hypothetical protein